MCPYPFKRVPALATVSAGCWTEGEKVRKTVCATKGTKYKPVSLISQTCIHKTDAAKRELNRHFQTTSLANRSHYMALIMVLFWSTTHKHAYFSHHWLRNLRTPVSANHKTGNSITAPPTTAHAVEYRTNRNSRFITYNLKGIIIWKKKKNL